MSKLTVSTIKDIPDFDLEETFECGQCFRWNKVGDAYIGVANHKVCKLTPGSIVTDELYEYFDLGLDYGKIKRELAKREPSVLPRAIESGSGIRILRQDIWETIVSFIISQNNNIPRIKGCIENLAKTFGEEIGELGGVKYYDIPTAEVLAGLTIEDLAPIRLGYRAKFLIKTAQQVLVLDKPLDSLTYTDLLSLEGVGPKVASCIELFGLHRLDAFPIDVWVKRVMHETYGFDENDVKGMKEFADKKFSPYGGIAQQYLFNYIRNAK